MWILVPQFGDPSDFVVQWQWASRSALWAISKETGGAGWSCAKIQSCVQAAVFTAEVSVRASFRNFSIWYSAGAGAPHSIAPANLLSLILPSPRVNRISATA